MDHDSNPYASPAEKTETRSRTRRTISTIDVFIAFAMLAFLSLLFAPGQPHPEAYSPMEELLLRLTYNWVTIIAYILVVASVATTLVVGLRHVIRRLHTESQRP